MKRLLLLLPFIATQSALSAEEAFKKCRLIGDIEERVACYDAVVDSNYAMNSRDSNAPRTSPQATATNTVPDAQSLFGTDDAEAKRIVETTLAIEQIRQIEARVTKVKRSATRKLTVALDNGQVWRQLDNNALRLESGEAVIIRKASLGSYLLEKESGSRRIRVKRAN